MELTKEILKKSGFVSVYDHGTAGYESAFYLRGGDPDDGWKVVIDLMMPRSSYVRNKHLHREYEGPINTVEELRSAIFLCKVPVKLITE